MPAESMKWVEAKREMLLNGMMRKAKRNASASMLKPLNKSDSVAEPKSKRIETEKSECFLLRYVKLYASVCGA